jgi:hypothetical protein
MTPLTPLPPAPRKRSLSPHSIFERDAEADPDMEAAESRRPSLLGRARSRSPGGIFERDAEAEGVAAERGVVTRRPGFWRAQSLSEGIFERVGGEREGGLRMGYC